MKKKLSAILSACLVIVMLFALVGCKVAGNTYVFDEVKVIEGEPSATILGLAEDLNKNVTYEFTDGGKLLGYGLVTVDYVQDGNEIKVGDKVVFTVSGSRIYITEKTDNYEYRIYFKKK